MVATIFSSLSIVAIAAGGLLSAFTARRPTRSMAWASAYLVLIVGVVQLGLVAAWQGLGHPQAGTVLSALCIYNLGNISVMAGTLLKSQVKRYRLLVNSGGLLLAVAMILLAIAARNSPVSLHLVEFIALLAIILASMPVGLLVSGRRHKAVASNSQ